MREYKLNKNKKDSVPSDEVIDKHKSFDQLRASYNDVVKRPSVPLYRNRKLFLLLLLLGLVAWIIAEAIEDKKDSDTKENPTEITP